MTTERATFRLKEMSDIPSCCCRIGLCNSARRDTPVTKAGEESINTGDELNENEARRARRAIARMNYMSQDRPDTCPGLERG